MSLGQGIPCPDCGCMNWARTEQGSYSEIVYLFTEEELVRDWEEFYKDWELKEPWECTDCGRKASNELDERLSELRSHL